MCGIAGIFDFKNKTSPEALKNIAGNMAQSMVHRGPDSGGNWSDPESGLTLSHRRLSIIDLSAEGHQPMQSHSGRYVISYNGEIYNFSELRADLEKLGVSFISRSDTEVLLAAFDQWGVSQTLQKINGMFAFALYDRRLLNLHLVRDRLGKKPLYMGLTENHFIFASELKAFHECPSFQPRINRDSLALYMRYAYYPDPFCVFEDVYSLPPSTVMTIGLEHFDPGIYMPDLFEPYWSLKRVIEDTRNSGDMRSESQTIDAFEKALFKAVETRMVSDVPLGAFLSGGLDSSLVTAIMQHVSHKPVKTFSVGFSETGYDEAAHARKIAEHLGTEHFETCLSARDALDIIPDLPRIYDEPFADASQIPTALISAFARKEVTVALSGDGGDELMGGYQRHFAIPPLWSKLKLIPYPLRLLLSGMIGTMPDGFMKYLGRFSPQLDEKIEKIQKIFHSKSPDALYHDIVSHWNTPETLVPVSNSCMPPVIDPSTDIADLRFEEMAMYKDSISYLPGDILVKVDRASMAHSLEMRAPLLDYRLFEFAWRMPLHYKIRNGKGKWLLRQVLSRHVPQELFERPKQGFSVPIRDWLKGPLKSWAEHLMDENRLKEQNLFNTEMVRTEWASFLKNKKSSGNISRLWTFLMFQAWYDTWIDKKGG